MEEVIGIVIDVVFLGLIYATVFGAPITNIYNRQTAYTIAVAVSQSGDLAIYDINRNH